MNELFPRDEDLSIDHLIDLELVRPLQVTPLPLLTARDGDGSDLHLPPAVRHKLLNCSFHSRIDLMFDVFGSRSCWCVWCLPRPPAAFSVVFSSGTLLLVEEAADCDENHLHHHHNTTTGWFVPVTTDEMEKNPQKDKMRINDTVVLHLFVVV